MRGEWLSGSEVTERFGWMWAALVAFGCASAIGAIIREIRRGEAFSVTTAVRAFLAFNVIYVIATSSVLEYGENNRLRFPIDPLVVALSVPPLIAAVSRLRRRSPS
jgi:hypothetical protein